MQYLATRVRNHPVRWAFAAFALLAVWVVFSTGYAGAQATEDPVEVFRETKGQHALSITMLPARPTVGVVHFNIMPTDAASAAAVQDAVITVIANSPHVTEQYPNGKPEYQVRAINNPDDRRSYAANMTIEYEGLWTFDVVISSSSIGAETFTVPLEIGELPIDPGAEGGLILALILIAFTGGSIYLIRSSKKAIRRREAARQATAS